MLGPILHLSISLAAGQGMERSKHRFALVEGRLHTRPDQVPTMNLELNGRLAAPTAFGEVEDSPVVTVIPG